MSEVVYVGLGSNLGDRHRNLRAAIDALGRIDAVTVEQVSAFYDTAPVGPEQPRYLNAVVEMSCALSPMQLFSILKRIEVEVGRTPGPKWGPRVLDMDILLWGERVVAEPALQIPHVEMHRRRFVLEPLAEIAPHARHPLLALTASEMLAQVVAQDGAPWEAA
ncbi:MAG: 2-amino-4-hydroxy-6-hydroxymethyldihydropteridine diphosphokinase [Myxococcaceae bacterium]